MQRQLVGNSYLKFNSQKQIKKVTKLIEQKPDNADYYSFLGDAYYLQKNYDAAIESYLKCLSIEPFHLAAQVNLGSVYFMTNQHDLSLHYYKKALELDPDNKNLIRTYQHVFFEATLNRQISLDDYINDLLRHPKNHNYAYFIHLGMAYQKKGDLLNSQEAYEAALIVNPKSAYIYKLCGDIYQMQDNRVAALHAYHRAEELDPDDPYLCNELGNIYFELNGLVQAMFYYTKSITLDPFDADIFHNRAQLYEELHDDVNAFLDYVYAFELNPTDKEFKMSIEKLIFNLNQDELYFFIKKIPDQDIQKRLLAQCLDSETILGNYMASAKTDILQKIEYDLQMNRLTASIKSKIATFSNGHTTDNLASSRSEPTLLHAVKNSN